MSELYGLIAEFDSADDLVEAAERTRSAGYFRFDTYSPFAIDELPEVMDLDPPRIWLFVLVGAAGGAFLAFAGQYYALVINYPMNIGGRPFFSLPAFVPIIFELAVLGAAVCGIIGMFVLNRLPMPYHPVFNHPDFADSSRDRFFLCIEARDPHFKLEQTRDFLHTLGPLEVTHVDT